MKTSVFLSKDQKKKLREICRKSYDESEGSIHLYKRLVRERLEASGSIMGWLIIIEVCLSIAISLWQIWIALNLKKAPRQPIRQERAVL